ncbi:hypothetical protein BC830DRAFT_1175899, partial [Chytriomyces sp. MP71]
AIGLPGFNKKHSIAQKVEELKADAVIVGSRGLNKLSKAFLGSVSEYLARHCTCPVVIVRATEEELKERGFSSAAEIALTIM